MLIGLRSELINDRAKSTLVAIFYGLCSGSMNFLNKAVVSSYEFNYPFFIMVCQMTVTVIFLDLFRLTGIVNIPAYSVREGYNFFIASFCFALHAALSLSALHGMNIPMYGAIKRCTPLINLFLSVFLLKKAAPSKYVVLSVLIITVGILIASIGDFDFDKHAYLMGGLSVFAQGSYLTLVQKSSEGEKSVLEMVHINGYNTLPFFAFMSIITGEASQVSCSKGLEYYGFYPTFLTLIIWGSVLTYSQFLCASVCSALTASLVGVGKSVIQTFVGFFTFGGVKFHPLNILGIMLNLIGGTMYSCIKYQEGSIKRQKMEEKEKLINAVTLLENGILRNSEQL